MTEKNLNNVVPKGTVKPETFFENEEQERKAMIACCVWGLICLAIELSMALIVFLR